MKLKHITDFLVVFVFSGMALYDVLPFLSDEEGDTISEAVQYAASRSPVVPFVLAVLLGHWFLPRAEPWLKQPDAAFLLIFVAWCVFLVGLVLRDATSLMGDEHGLLLGSTAVLLGLVAGHGLWPLPPID